jgi:hypothetical protein
LIKQELFERAGQVARQRLSIGDNVILGGHPQEARAASQSFHTGS